MEGEAQATKRRTPVLSQLKDLRNSMELYCHQLPVLGFNSSKYDLNLLKTQLIFQLNPAEDKSFHVIRKLNQYTCIASSHFKFLDISNYLSPGYSYAKFLKAYDVSGAKSFFPYEFLDHADKLKFPCLPDYEAFYSSLKQKVSVTKKLVS